MNWKRSILAVALFIVVAALMIPMVPKPLLAQIDLPTRVLNLETAIFGGAKANTTVPLSNITTLVTNTFISCGTTSTCTPVVHGSTGQMISIGPVAMSGGTVSVTGLPALTYDGCVASVTSSITATGPPGCAISGTTVVLSVTSGGSASVAAILTGH